MATTNTVDVFPISTSAFGLRPDWYEAYTPQFIRPSYMLMVLMIVISVGIMVIRRFEHSEIEKKAWNIPILVLVVSLWPGIVLGLKSLVDSFNTFLVVKIFGMTWSGFGFPDIGNSNLLGWSMEGLARLLPVLAYWIIYAFYLIFFFFYVVLGPLLLAKGILADEVETILELTQEVVTLLLWQTTVAVLVAFLMPDIVSGKPFPARPEVNYYLLSIILGIMILFVPSLTRKLTRHINESFAPLGLRWGGFMLGASVARRVGSPAVTALGVDVAMARPVRSAMHAVASVEEFQKRYEHHRRIQDLEDERDRYESELREKSHQVRHYAEEHHGEGKSGESKDLFSLAKKAKADLQESPKGNGQ